MGILKDSIGNLFEFPFYFLTKSEDKGSYNKAYM